MLIYFIRHGLTTWNIEKRCQGHLSNKLSEFGRNQAKRNGLILRNNISSSKFKFVCSPIFRAQETMQLICDMFDNNITYTLDNNLIEINRGVWQGLLWSEIERKFALQSFEYSLDKWNIKPSCGESFSELYQRVGEWLISVDCNTVVVSHGGVMKCVQGIISALSPKEIFELDSPQDKILCIENKTKLSWL